MKAHARVAHRGDGGRDLRGRVVPDDDHLDVRVCLGEGRGDRSVDERLGPVPGGDHDGDERIGCGERALVRGVGAERGESAAVAGVVVVDHVEHAHQQRVALLRALRLAVDPGAQLGEAAREARDLLGERTERIFGRWLGRGL